MSRIPVFASPLLLGFDELERRLDLASKASGDSYPPYNIERFPPHPDGSENFRITLAVAGFARVDIDITLENRQLSVRGKQKDEAGHEFLHRGIAARQFSKSFILAEGMDVTGARMQNGLLAIDMRQSPPDRVVRRIDIKE